MSVARTAVRTRCHAGEDPQQAGQIAHLRGEHRADQGAGAGNGREVVAVEHVFVRRHIVQAVVVPPGRRHALAVQAEDLGGEEEAVVAVGDQVDADRGHHHPERGNGLAASERHGRQLSPSLRMRARETFLPLK